VSEYQSLSTNLHVFSLLTEFFEVKDALHHQEMLQQQAAEALSSDPGDYVHHHHPSQWKISDTSIFALMFNHYFNFKR